MLLSIASLAVSMLLSKPLLDLHPIIVWNASKSIPIGLYRVEKSARTRGEVAVLRLPPWAETMASERRYLPRDAWLLKPVAAVHGDVVCRFGRHVFVNGSIAARALARDKSERVLPVWRGCKRLSADEFFVLSRHADSFDSRYFGAVSSEFVIGTAKPLIILQK